MVVVVVERKEREMNHKLRRSRQVQPFERVFRPREQGPEMFLFSEVSLFGGKKKKKKEVTNTEPHVGVELVAFETR